VRAPAASDTSGIDDKPPLIARDASDRARMERWLNAELNTTGHPPHSKKWPSDAAVWIVGTDGNIEELRAWLKSDAAVIRAAKHGDLGPAREKYPELAAADMLKLPRQGRGKRFPKVNVLTRYEVKLTGAVWDAAKMRAILTREYTPRRPKGYDSPEAMAAHRRGVNEEHVRAWAKNRRCPKRPVNFLKTQ
jgi:hypothetical protein